MRPLLLDLYCGAGGAAKGYDMAGFQVVGVDDKTQPNYPYPMCEGDALWLMDHLISGKRAYFGDRRYGIGDFAAIHASPPCQAHSTVSGRAKKGRPGRYECFIARTRARLKASGLPYVIENVVGAPLIAPVMLCGSSFKLDVRRHRLFESNVLLMAYPCDHSWQTPRFRSLDSRRKTLASVVGVHGHVNYAGESELRKAAMQIDWMTMPELSQSIPPAFTEFIGKQLIATIDETAPKGARRN